MQRSSSHDSPSRAYGRHVPMISNTGPEQARPSAHSTGVTSAGAIMTHGWPAGIVGFRGGGAPQVPAQQASRGQSPFEHVPDTHSASTWHAAPEATVPLSAQAAMSGKGAWSTRHGPARYGSRHRAAASPSKTIRPRATLAPK